MIGRSLRRAGSAPTRDERGSAVVEFVFLAVVLLIPLVYLVLTLARVHAGAFAVSAAAREAGRVFVATEAEGQAGARARAAAELAFEDHDFGGDGRVRIACTATPCLTPGAAVVVDAELNVPLPLIPAFARGVVPLSVPVSSTARLTVDRYRGTP